MLCRRFDDIVPLVLASSVLLGGARAQDKAVGVWLQQNLAGLVELYRDLHRRPELSFREVKTAARFASELERAGFEVTRGVGGLGVVAVLCNGEGPTVMLRADLDGLPIGEMTGLPYQSELRKVSEDGRVAGVMHACGHDVHMTGLIGTARYLAGDRERWQGTVICIGQPAEERAGGAKAMLEDGLFERFPRPDFALALHVAHDLPAGQVAYRAGASMANVESVDITMYGRAGHGAAPHLAIDPVVQASQLVLQLQTIVSREISPTDPAVITVGSIHGGSKHNIIDDRCHLQVTVRSYAPAVHQQLLRAIERKARAVAQGARAPEPEISFSEFTPVLINDAALVDRVVGVFRRELGADQVVDMPPVLTAEDFGRFGRAGVPIFMFRLGSVAESRLARYAREGVAPPPLHSGKYFPDPEPTLGTGVRCTVAAVLDLLGG